MVQLGYLFRHLLRKYGYFCEFVSSTHWVLLGSNTSLQAEIGGPEQR
jgi:hypothetical protein